MNAKLPDWNNWLTEEAAGCHTDSTTAPNESRQPPWKKKLKGVIMMYFP